MFNLIGTLIGGLFVGALARWLYPAQVPMGWGMTMLLGIGGSLAASLLVTRGRYDGGVNRPGCLASVVGAMLLIFIGRHLGWH